MTPLAVHLASLVALVAAAVSCGSNASAPGAVDAPLATQACTAASRPAVREVVVGVDDETRRALVHVPQSIESDAAPPLVLAFHGFGGSPVAMEVGSGMSAKADEAGFVAVYPEGTGFSAEWDLVGTRDTDFAEELLSALEAEVCFDLRRVYATGFSLGGGMANVVGCRLADRVAAIAPVSGVYLQSEADACLPSQPVPVVAVHGALDDAVPFAGGTTRGEEDVTGAESWAADWAERNECHQGPPQERSMSDSVEALTWAECRAPVELYVLKDGGHTWPGSPLDAGSETASDFSATDVIWEFFVRHALPAS